MSKKLIIIRHAKSSWKKPLLEDFDRGLNKRGKFDAPLMGEILMSKNIYPQRVILSSSVRTKETWRLLNTQIEASPAIAMDRVDLYHANPNEILQAINEESDEYETLFCIGHNPGMTYFVNSLCDADIDNIPTTGIAIIEVENFSQLEFGQGKLIEFIYPKMYKEN